MVSDGSPVLDLRYVHTVALIPRQWHGYLSTPSCIRLYPHTTPVLLTPSQLACTAGGENEIKIGVET